MAETAKSKYQPDPHPIVRKLEAAAAGDSVVMLEGFVGKGSSDRLRLYGSLDLRAYWDIPREDVLAAEELSSDERRTRVFVRGSSNISATSTVTTCVTACDLSSTPGVVARIRRGELLPALQELADFRAELDRFRRCSIAQQRAGELHGALNDALASGSLDQASAVVDALGEALDAVKANCGGATSS